MLWALVIPKSDSKVNRQTNEKGTIQSDKCHEIEGQSLVRHGGKRDLVMVVYVRGGVGKIFWSLEECMRVD